MTDYDHPLAAVWLPCQTEDLSRVNDEFGYGDTEWRADNRMLGALVLWRKGRSCGCAGCDTRVRNALAEMGGGTMARMAEMRMILCPECGNKRCPRATFHENTCTNSNDPGQLGSVYGGL